MPNRASVAETISMLRELSPTGFATALHIRFTSSTFLFQSYPGDWITEYTGRGLHLQDPNVIWGFTNEGWMRWSELAKQDPAGVIAAAGRHGMSYGAALGLVRNGSRSIGGFSRGDREFTDAELAELETVLELLHDQTEGGSILSAADQKALREMSVRMTHN